MFEERRNTPGRPGRQYLGQLKQPGVSKETTSNDELQGAWVEGGMDGGKTGKRQSK
jgi:hypothetical protein